MGAGWRRWKERVRESMPGAQDLTSNARNRSMMKTATDFSNQVRRCEKAIRAASAANAELLSTTKGTMMLPLPQTYDETNNGAGSATAALNLVGGPHFKADAVGRVANETQHKLETEVLAPLTRWQDVHLQLAARFKDLEGTRLELDSRRRTVMELSTRVSAMRAKLGSAGGHKPEAKLDSTIRQLSHKEAKLKVTTQNFDQQEALLARDLAALIADGQYLKHYVAAALRLQGGALLGAADSFGELASAPVITAPAPVPSATGTPTGTMTGAGAAGFGASAGSLAPAPPLSGRNTADGSNPYHSNNGPVTSSLSQSDRPASYGGGAPGSMGQTKRFSEPEVMEKPVGLPKGAVPVEQSTPPPSDNPYSVRNYSYA